MPLKISCNTTSISLLWNITYIRDNTGILSETGFVFYDTWAATSSSLMIHRSTINFTRTSMRYALPLTATLLIDPVTEDLNQIVISCIQISSNAQEATVVTIVDQHYSKSMKG